VRNNRFLLKNRFFEIIAQKMYIFRKFAQIKKLKNKNVENTFNVFFSRAETG
jgi:hypothetical protein